MQESFENYMTGIDSLRKMTYQEFSGSRTPPDLSNNHRSSHYMDQAFLMRVELPRPPHHTPTPYSLRHHRRRAREQTNTSSTSKRWASLRPHPAATLFPLLLVSSVGVALLVVGVEARAPPAVEHRVGGDDALRAARRLAPRSDSLHASAWGTEGDAAAAWSHSGGLDALEAPPGCLPCTRAEQHYCAGADVIHDHCCCDMRYHEAFPFVPHTCYLRDAPCTPLAADCQDYERIRTCCCDQMLRRRWSPSGSPVTCASAVVQVVLPLFLTLLLR